MLRELACAGLAGLSLSVGAAAQETLVLPSGVGAEAYDVIWDEDLSAIRMRFVVPRLAEPGSIYAGDALRVFEDMLWLCETRIGSVLPERAQLQDEGWTSVVISLMDRPIEFGARHPEVFQVFEWFTLTMDGCELDVEELHE